MSLFFDQVVQFTTDNVGLERILRLVQAVCMLLSLYDPVSTCGQWGLLALSIRLDAVRRWMRLFRFLDSFRASVRAVTWLQAASFSLFAIQGLLESVTLLDLQDIPCLPALGAGRTAFLTREALQCWFLGLAFAVVARFEALPTAIASATALTSTYKKNVHPQLRAELHRAEIRRDEMRRVTADTLDMFLPLAALGWYDSPPWRFATVMVVTSLSACLDTWQLSRDKVRVRVAVS